MGSQMDARTRRTRERLSAAILKLTAERDAGSVSVSELAREAGVHRSTVYEHAESPAALLRLVLRGELDEIRARHLVDIPENSTSEALEATTRDVLRHVEAHEAVYARALGADDDAALHIMLSSHFRGSSMLLFESGAVTPPEGVDPVMVARFLADGTAGAIDVWLRTPSPRDHDAFLTAYRLLLPEWWPL